MRNSNAHIYESHHSSATKYYNLLLILLIATPLAIGCYVSLQGPWLFTLTMFLTCIPIIALITYLAISSNKLKYELTPKELKIKMGLLNKKIPYNQITQTETIQLSLILKIYGAGMPGLYWGTFTTPTGYTQAYCTKRKGEYISLTLTNDQKIALSPKNNQQFLNALNQQKNNTTYQTNKKTTQTTNNNVIYTQILMVTVAYCAFLSYFFTTYTALPQIIPLQIDFNGLVTRWGNKTELLWLIGLVTSFPIINTAIALKFGKYTRNLLIVLGITFIATTALLALTLHTTTTIIPH
jgi:hypothetical protein